MRFRLLSQLCLFSCIAQGRDRFLGGLFRNAVENHDRGLIHQDLATPEAQSSHPAYDLGQWPQPRKKQRGKESRLDPYKSLIDGMLRADLDAPPEQRHTTQRIYDRLVESHRLVTLGAPPG